MTRRRASYALAWLLVFAASVMVPMPWFQVSPGSAIEVTDLVVLDGEPAPALHGSAALLAVNLRRPSIVEVAWAKFDDRRDLVPLDRYLRDGQNDVDYFASQAVVFDDTFTISAATAMSAAGLEVMLEQAPIITGVLPGGPADGHLRPGDVLLTINGTAVQTAEDLVTQARRLDVGDDVVLEAERDGAPLTIAFAAGILPRMERPGLGVTIDTVTRDVQLPIDLRLADDLTIGGPSAGLLFAITVYDLVSDEDLLAGRRVAGTGTLNFAGEVGRIGSIRQKVGAAVAEGYDVFLAPASQAQDARDAAGDDIWVVSVERFEDAITSIRDAPLPS